MRKVKYYKCPECQKKFKTMTGWAEHMNTMHPNVRPEGFSDSRFFYYILTGMTAGKCIECKSPTEWNEATAKYNRFCNNPNCKKSYVKLAKSRMISKYGKEYLLNDPDMQRKMLLSKKISGYYNFSNGSGKLGYVGTYEKDFLQMMDQFMGYSASDIMSPSPHTYFYDYNGKQHFYIPDFYIPNLNLEIEIKAQDNTHPKILAVDKVKEKLKDDVMSSNPKVNYLKINDKDYTSFFDYLLNLKESIDETAISSNGSISSEINQVLESAYEGEEETEVGFEYDPHLCSIREGVFEKFNYGDMRNSDLKLCIFTFFTTTSGTRHTGFASGYDGFSNIAFQSLTGAYDCASPVYMFTPEYEGDFASRTPGMYIREFKSYNDIHPFSPDNVSNEYMTFMVALRRDGWDRNQFDVNIIRRLRDKIYNDKPLLCDWDKISDDCVNNQNKYHYLCYGILNELLGERYRLYNDSDLFESEVIMIDRGLMCEFDWNRILDIINSYKYEIFEKPSYFYNIAREEFESYDELEPAMEKLLYENTFTDIEPAVENIQLHTNFDKVKVKGTLDLSKYRKITLSQEVLDKYKEKCASFGHCRISNMSRGYVWVDKSDNIVGFVNVVRKQDNVKWIQALNLQPNYQGYGLYEQLLKVAVRELGGTDIETPPKNDTAKEVYNKFGFKVYTDEQSRRCMSIRADAARNKYGDKAKTNATSMTEAGLFPVYVILTNASKLEGDYAKLLTKSNYAHVSLAFNASMQEVYSFGTKDGHTMLPISTEAKNLMYKLKTDPEANYAIYTKLVSKKDFESISSKVKSMYAQKGGFNYDMPQAVKDKMNSDSVNEKKYFCSSFVAYLMGVSRNVSEIPDIKNIYLVDMGLVKDYKQAFIEKKTNAVYEKHYMQKEKNSDKQPIDEESND